MDMIDEIINDIIAENYTYLSSSSNGDKAEIQKSIALLQVRTDELKANTELAGHYFEQQEEEKEKLLDSAYKVLEKASNNGDAEIVQIAMLEMDIANSKDV